MNRIDMSIVFVYTVMMEIILVVDAGLNIPEKILLAVSTAAMINAMLYRNSKQEPSE